MTISLRFRLRMPIIVVLVSFILSAAIGFGRAGKPGTTEDRRKGDLYIAKGKRLVNAGSFSAALEMFDKALPFYQKAGTPRGQGYVYFWKGMVYKKTGKNPRAIEMLDRALPFFEKTGYTLGRGTVYFNKGGIYYDAGNYETALEMYTKALPFYKRAGYILGQGLVYYGQAQAYFAGRDTLRSLEVAQKALTCFEKTPEKEVLGGLYRGLAAIFSINNDRSRALETFNKALTLLKNAGETQEEANVYLDIGAIYMEKKDFESALDMYGKAVALFEKTGDINGQGTVYVKKGEIYSAAEEFDKAIEMYDKALPFFEKAGNLVEQGNVYTAKGMIYLYDQNRPKAQAMYKKAHFFYREAENTESLAYLYTNMAVTYMERDNSKALELYQKALDIYLKLENYDFTCLVYAMMGTTYLTAGDNNKARELYQDALPICRKCILPMVQKSFKVHEGISLFFSGEYLKAQEIFDKALTVQDNTMSAITDGLVYQYKGETYAYTGNIAKAFDMYNKALALYKQWGAFSRIDQGNVYRRKGELYLRFGDFLKASEMYEQSMLFYEKKKSWTGQGAASWGKAMVYGKTGEYAKALEMYDKAMSFFNKAGSPWGHGAVCISKGKLYLEMGDADKAMDMCKKALLLFKKLGSLQGRAEAYQAIGDAHLANDDTSKALDMYDKTLPINIKLMDIQSHAYTLHKKAEVLRKLKRTDEALPLYEKALSKLEKFRQQTAFSDLKQSLMETVSEQYEKTVSFMLENQYYHRGFKYAESMKARMFLDQLAEGLIPLEKGIEPTLKQKRDLLVAKLSIQGKKIQQETGPLDKQELEKLKEAYRKIEAELEDILVKIRLQNPVYASVRYPEPISVRDLQQDVLKEKELLLRYFISQGNVYVFVISRRDFNVLKLETNEKNINRLLNHYLLLTNEMDTRGTLKYAAQLYKKIFQPVEALSKGYKQLIIIPDGQLTKIPFESFVTHRQKLPGGRSKPVYLLEKYRIKYIQSASALAMLRKYYPRPGNTRHFAGFGDPVYDYESFKRAGPGKTPGAPLPKNEVKEIHRGKYDREGGKFVRLKGSGEEVRAIAGLFEHSSRKATLYLREKASEEHAKGTGMNACDYIHFACHGVLGDGFQSLVLSQVPGAKEDGYFTLNEIMNCDYHAKLVVLSACRTGSGKIERAEGVTGLTRAVMHAGTPAVVASLWNVSDTGTKKLMIEFYMNILKKGMSNSDALRSAKLEMLKKGKYSSPFFWSAFVMYGE